MKNLFCILFFLGSRWTLVAQEGVSQAVLNQVHPMMIAGEEAEVSQEELAEFLGQQNVFEANDKSVTTPSVTQLTNSRDGKIVSSVSSNKDDLYSDFSDTDDIAEKQTSDQTVKAIVNAQLEGSLLQTAQAKVAILSLKKATGAKAQFKRIKRRLKKTSSKYDTASVASSSTANSEALRRLVLNKAQAEVGAYLIKGQKGLQNITVRTELAAKEGFANSELKQAQLNLLKAQRANNAAKEKFLNAKNSYEQIIQDHKKPSLEKETASLEWIYQQALILASDTELSYQQQAEILAEAKLATANAYLMLHDATSIKDPFYKNRADVTFTTAIEAEQNAENSTVLAEGERDARSRWCIAIEDAIKKTQATFAFKENIELARESLSKKSFCTEEWHLLIQLMQEAAMSWEKVEELSKNKQAISFFELQEKWSEDLEQATYQGGCLKAEATAYQACYDADSALKKAFDTQEEKPGTSESITAWKHVLGLAKTTVTSWNQMGIAYQVKPLPFWSTKLNLIESEEACWEVKSAWCEANQLIDNTIAIEIAATKLEAGSVENVMAWEKTVASAESTKESLAKAIAILLAKKGRSTSEHLDRLNLLSDYLNAQNNQWISELNRIIEKKKFYDLKRKIKLEEEAAYRKKEATLKKEIEQLQHTVLQLVEQAELTEGKALNSDASSQKVSLWNEAIEMKASLKVTLGKILELLKQGEAMALVEYKDGWHQEIIEVEKQNEEIAESLLASRQARNEFIKQERLREEEQKKELEALLLAEKKARGERLLSSLKEQWQNILRIDVLENQEEADVQITAIKNAQQAVTEWLKSEKVSSYQDKEFLNRWALLAREVQLKKNSIKSAADKNRDSSYEEYKDRINTKITEVMFQSMKAEVEGNAQLAKRWKELLTNYLDPALNKIKEAEKASQYTTPPSLLEGFRIEDRADLAALRLDYHWSNLLAISSSHPEKNKAYCDAQAQEYKDNAAQAIANGHEKLAASWRQAADKAMKVSEHFSSADRSASGSRIDHDSYNRSNQMANNTLKQLASLVSIAKYRELAASVATSESSELEQVWDEAITQHGQVYEAQQQFWIQASNGFTDSAHSALKILQSKSETSILLAEAATYKARASILEEGTFKMAPYWILAYKLTQRAATCETEAATSYETGDSKSGDQFAKEAMLIKKCREQLVQAIGQQLKIDVTVADSTCNPSCI